MAVDGAGEGGDSVERCRLSRLLRLMCCMVARAEMPLTLQDVVGSDVLPAHGNLSRPQGGLLGILCGCDHISDTAAGGGKGGMDGGIESCVVFASEERVLALCALILWPRTKAVIPAHVITAALRTLWNRFEIFTDARLARAREEGGGGEAEEGRRGGEVEARGRGRGGAAAWE